MKESRVLFYSGARTGVLLSQHRRESFRHVCLISHKTKPCRNEKLRHRQQFLHLGCDLLTAHTFPSCAATAQESRNAHDNHSLVDTSSTKITRDVSIMSKPAPWPSTLVVVLQTMLGWMRRIKAASQCQTRKTAVDTWYSRACFSHHRKKTTSLIHVLRASCGEVALSTAPTQRRRAKLSQAGRERTGLTYSRYTKTACGAGKLTSI